MVPFTIVTKSKIFGGYTGFSFFVFIWVSDLSGNRERVIRHERIHFYQQLELAFVLHWFLYCSFYFMGRIKGMDHHKAYRNNPFEKEAYAHDLDVTYLSHRKPWSWIRYW